MTQLLAAIGALVIAVHVSLPGLPAPVPVLLAFAAAIGVLCWLIFESAYRPAMAAAGRAGP